MRSYLIVCALTAGMLLSAVKGGAQTPYALTKTGTAREMAQYDENGKLTGYQVYEVVENVRKGDATIYWMSCYLLNEKHVNDGFTPMRMGVTVENGAATDYAFAGVIFQECVGLITKASSGSSQSSIANSKIRVTGELGTIPSVMKPGSVLPDSEMKVTAIGIPITISCSDRNVLGEETLKTGAGSFKCTKLEETVTIKLLLFTKKIRIVSWYAPGIGEIRNEAYLKTRSKTPDSHTVLCKLR